MEQLNNLFFMKFFDSQTIDKIRCGYYTASYFNRTKEILLAEKNFRVATMQIFQKHEGSILCGVEEVIELLKAAVGYFEKDEWIDKWNTLKVKSLSDGDRLSSWETVMHITGPYVYFANLESVYLGILARRTLVATNTRGVVEAAGGKPVICFADRFDIFLNQEGDGYAAKVGGANAVCTQAHCKWLNEEPVGTIPHALIAINKGDTVAATLQFAKHMKGANVVALVDFDNDCVGTSLKAARCLGKKLWGVRLDTPENVIDKSLQNEVQPRKELYGVNPILVRLVRKALNQEGFIKVKIIVSSGFNEQKIAWFEKERAPVDVYAVGSALIHGENDFTADIVKVEGKKLAKVGREYRDNSKLKVKN